MTTKTPRIQVTLDQGEYEVIQILAKKNKLSASAVIKKMVDEWLEEYEDMLLARRAEAAMKEWEESGRQTVSHEDLCKKYNIE